jgi:hypothetical protein
MVSSAKLGPLNLLCVFLASSACSLAAPPPAKNASPIQGSVALSPVPARALSGKRIIYAAGDGNGHILLSLDGPESFYSDGTYKKQLHRGSAYGTYSVAEDQFCVSYAEEHHCRVLLRSTSGSYFVRGVKGDDAEPWPVIIEAIPR